MRRYKVTLTTDASGNAVGYTPRIAGEIHQIEYVKDTASAGANAYANGVDFTITGEATGVNLWTQLDVNASVVVAPRMPTHDRAGAASLYASGGTGVQTRVGLASDRVKISIAQGGNTKVGAFHVVVA
ncbi:hypothetical protein RPMA_12425 [Tardiphaga alba]|uniref:Uncharacterized protein n=1 Tax=Tardiphaga alba TaxID=340268 RepID=A0ABX8A7E3_9BRAD|nr:hypothetical protein [Tardiphaga alba]QUS39552.1 hypothetical protein RPMA_12425 [Tardiphaga alba]